MFGKNRTTVENEKIESKEEVDPRSPQGAEDILKARSIHYAKVGQPGKIASEILTNTAFGKRSILIDGSEDSILHEIQEIVDHGTVMSDLRDVGIGIVDDEDDLPTSLDRALVRQRALTVLRAECLADSAVIELVKTAADRPGGAEVVVLAR